MIIMVLAASAAMQCQSHARDNAPSAHAQGSASEEFCETGLEEHPLSLAIVGIERQRLPNGLELIVISGSVTNQTNQIHRVPRISAQVRDGSGELLHSWIIVPPTAPVPAGKSAAFRSAEVNVPPGGQEITLSFALPQQD